MQGRNDMQRWRHLVITAAVAASISAPLAVGVTLLMRSGNGTQGHDRQTLVVQEDGEIWDLDTGTLHSAGRWSSISGDHTYADGTVMGVVIILGSKGCHRVEYNARYLVTNGDASALEDAPWCVKIRAAIGAIREPP